MSTVGRVKPKTLPALEPGQHLDQPTFHERYEAMPPQTQAELVVEIARSSRHYDLNEKKADYQRAGVLEYLVIELDPNRIHWFIRRGQRFGTLRAGPDGIYRSKVFPGLWLDPQAVFSGDRVGRDEIVERGVQTPEHAAFLARLAAARDRARGRN